MKETIERNNILLSLVAILLFSGLIFFETWQSTVDIWMRTGTYAHGFFVLPASIWFVFIKRDNLASLKVQPSWLALAFLVLNGMFWLMGDLIDALVVEQFALVGLLIAVIWFYVGNEVSKAILFPLLFLYFMVPFGESLLPYLMSFTANFTVKLLRLTGVPVYQEGLYFTLTSGNWSVVEACSGIRYLIASITLGLVYAYLNYTHFYKRLIFTIVATIVPILANGLRAYMIVMIGHLFSAEMAMGIAHFIYGTILFGVIMLFLFYIGSFWKDEPIVEPIKHQNLKQILLMAKSPYDTPKTTLLLIIIFVGLAVWPLGAHWLKSAYKASDRLNDVTASMPQPWKKVEAPDWPWRQSLNGVKTEAMNFFSDGENTLAYYQASFGDETQGSELVNSNNNVNRLLKDKWRLVYAKKINAELDSGKQTIDEYSVKGINENYGRYMLIWKWYQVGAWRTSSPYMAKLLQLFKRLTLNTEPEILIMLMLEVDDSNAPEMSPNLLQMMSFFDSLAIR